MSSKTRFIVIAAIVLAAAGMFYVNHRIINAPSPAKPAAATSENSGAIEWVYDLASARKISNETGRPIMADFYADWCGWCKKLDEDVYSVPEVIEMAGYFVCVKLDADFEKNLSAQYEIRGLPSIVFMKADGKVIRKIEGYVEAKEMLSIMDSIRKK